MRSHTLARLGSTAAAALVTTMLVGGPPAHAEGPDAVRDPGTFTGGALPAGDDGSAGPVPLGFAASFFGTTYTSVHVNNNGNITFDAPSSQFNPSALGSGGPKMIAAFLGDVDTRRAGLTSYGVGTVDGHPAFAATWSDVGYWTLGADKRNTFQVVLVQRADTGNPGNFDIELNYDKVQWEAAVSQGGSGGLGGNAARAGYSSGSGEVFELPGSGVTGALLDANEETGLVHGSLHSTHLGRYVLQVRDGVVVFPTNQAPEAVAGDDVSGQEGTAVALDGSASTDPDGDDLAYSWTVTGAAGNDSGAACVVADPTAAATSVTCNDDGSYTAVLTVDDGEEQSSDSVLLTIGNVAPVISTPAVSGASGVACLAGNTVGVSFELDDGGTNDLGSLGGVVDWGDGTSQSFTESSFTGTHVYAPGTYTLRVSASDGDGGTATEPLAVSHLFRAGPVLAPFEPDGSSNFRQGRTVPVKVQVTDCDGELVSSLEPRVDLTRVDGASATSPDGDSGTVMRWADDQYLHKLETRDLAAGRYRVAISDEAANASFAPVVTELTLH